MITLAGSEDLNLPSSLMTVWGILVVFTHVTFVPFVMVVTSVPEVASLKANPDGFFASVTIIIFTSLPPVGGPGGGAGVPPPGAGVPPPGMGTGEGTGGGMLTVEV
jgi:hypothetical protein